MAWQELAPETEQIRYINNLPYVELSEADEQLDLKREYPWLKKLYQKWLNGED